MYSIEQIVSMNGESGRKAKRHGIRPKLAHFDGENLTNIPHIGDYRPKGYSLIDTMFVDASGFGGKGEPALTLEEFYERVKAGFYYATIEAGQFQVYVGIFEKVK